MDALPKTKTITLSNGTEHELHELTFGDMVDLEESGIDMAEIMETQADGESVMKSRAALGKILWMLVRKRENDVAEWEPRERDFLHSMTLSDFQRVMPTMMEFLAAPFDDGEEAGTS